MKTLLIVSFSLFLAGCAASEKELAAEDDAKCRSYGGNVGSPAYVQCRSQLDAARTVARATIQASP